MRRQFERLIKILWQNYINDFLGIFTGWAIIILTLIAWLCFKDTSGATATYDKFVVASGIGVGCVRISLYNFGRTVFLFRRDNVLKKLNYIGISRISFFMAFILFNFIIVSSLSSTIVLIAICFKDQRESLQNINASLFLSGYVLMILTCQLIGYLAGMYLPSYEWVVVFGLLNYFFSIYLLGLGIPYNQIETNKIIYVLGYLLLLRPAIMLMDSGWISAPSLKFDLNGTTHSFGYFNNMGYLLLNIFLVILVLVLIIVAINIRKYSFKKSEHLISMNVYMNDFKNTINQLQSKEQIKQYLELNSITKKISSNKRKR